MSAAVQAEGKRRLAAIGFPTKRDEGWRFTNVNALVSAVQTTPRAVAPQTRGPVTDARGPGTEWLGKVAVEGAFSALNTSLLQDAAVVHVPRGVKLEQPIELTFAGDGFVQPRVLIVLEEGAEATVLEHHLTKGTANAVTEIVVGRNAKLNHVLWQAAPTDAQHIQTVAARVEGQLVTHALSFGGAISRIEVWAELFKAAELDAFGLMLGSGTQHQDNRTVITHNDVGGRSAQLWKSLLDDKSSAVFDGLIRVKHDAQKTNAGQQNKNLLLSREASITSKPHLEIYADDVKCAHGSTTGQLSDDSLFYLRARGINEKAARAMLAEGFAREIVDSIANEALRTRANEALLDWLKGAGT
jgi:Fe-S cluster assembly protein SufD